MSSMGIHNDLTSSKTIFFLLYFRSCSRTLLLFWRHRQELLKQNLSYLTLKRTCCLWYWEEIVIFKSLKYLCFKTGLCVLNKDYINMWPQDWLRVFRTLKVILDLIRMLLTKEVILKCDQTLKISYLTHFEIIIVSNIIY